MNNKTFTDMTKKTVFVGKINGETFDNVAAYNARLQELINSGVAVEASSETKVAAEPSNKNNVSCTCDVKNLPYNEQADYDADLTLYPYMYEDDPFYLDLLVTDDPVTNQEAYTEAQKYLKKCYDYTLNTVNDFCKCEQQEYLSELDEIVKCIDEDIDDTHAAIDKIGARRKKLDDLYHKELDKLDAELHLLESAGRVADMFKSYYSDVRANVNRMIAVEAHPYRCTDCPEHIETTVTETEPQTEFDFSKFLSTIFGADWAQYKRIRKI